MTFMSTMVFADHTVLQRLAIFHGQTATADFKIVNGNKEWPVHRIILALHSPVLEKACFSDFKEASDAKIDLSSEPRCAIEAFANFLYHNKYDAEVPEVTQPSDTNTAQNNTADKESNTSTMEVIGTLSLHAKMASLGEYFEMPHLTLKASNKFRSAIRKDKDLTSSMQDVLQAARIAYQDRSGLERICQTLVEYLVEHGTIFDEDAPTRCLAEAVLRSIPEFAQDYARALRLARSDVVERLAEEAYQCPGCQKINWLEIEDNGEEVDCYMCGREFTGIEWRQGFLIGSRSPPAMSTSGWWKK